MTDKRKLTTDEKIQKLVEEGHTGAANLTPLVSGSPEAKAFHEKGLAKRRENKAKREALKHAVKAFGDNKLEASEDLSSLDTLRILRNLYISTEEFDKVLEISKVLAEYEAPKKSRVEEIKSEVDFNDYEEEDVEAYLADVISLDELRQKKKA